MPHTQHSSLTQALLKSSSMCATASCCLPSISYCRTGFARQSAKWSRAQCSLCISDVQHVQSTCSRLILQRDLAEWRPPHGTDGTPNESAVDLLTRLRQVAPFFPPARHLLCPCYLSACLPLPLLWLGFIQTHSDGTESCNSFHSGSASPAIGCYAGFGYVGCPSYVQ